MRKFTVGLGVFAVSVCMVCTASAKTVYSSWVTKEILRGRSADDACHATVAAGLANIGAIDRVYQKHEKGGSWEKVAEAYGINLELFLNSAQVQKRDIPDGIYNEMKSEGMTDVDCYKFAMDARNWQVDIETAWKGKKDGKTAEEIYTEKTELSTKKAQLATDFVFGKITATDYTERMKEIIDDIDLKEIMDYARSEQLGWMKVRKAGSGISDEELQQAENAGVTNFFDACRLKDTERLQGRSFAGMLDKIKNGASIDEVTKPDVTAAADKADIE